jgi:hypothetical protein
LSNFSALSERRILTIVSFTFSRVPLMSNTNTDDAFGIFLDLTIGQRSRLEFKFRPAPCLNTTPVSCETVLPGAGNCRILIEPYPISGPSSSDENHDRTPEIDEGSTAVVSQPGSVSKGHQACLNSSTLNSLTGNRINYSNTPTSSHRKAPHTPRDLTPSRNLPLPTIADSVGGLSESPSAPPSAPPSGSKRKFGELEEEMGGKSGYEPKSKR